MTKAVLYRMVTDQHICPFGIKSRDLLKRKGFSIDDHQLQSREQTDQFKDEYDVKTTPQTFIDGRRIGGYEDLRRYLGLSPSRPEGTTYKPVIAVFATALMMAGALAVGRGATQPLLYTLETFVAISMCILAILKLRDLTAFTNQFVTYDLLSMHFVPYAYVYPFIEVWAGLAMLAGINAWFVSPFALFIGAVGAVSVFKAVYVDKRALKCACVGGGSNVPLGFVSLTENLMMIAAAIWMWVR